MFLPVLGLTLVCILSFLFNRPNEKEYWTQFLHYQTYWFLLPMIAIGAGSWQQKAVRNFFIGALVASTLFFLAYADLLPENTLFRSYVIYQGNKSILLGLLLALAAAWMLHELLLRRTHRIWRIIAFVYVFAALVLCSKSRTAALLFFLLLAVFACRNFSFRLWQIASVFGIFAVCGGCFICRRERASTGHVFGQGNAGSIPNEWT